MVVYEYDLIVIGGQLFRDDFYHRVGYGLYVFLFVISGDDY